MEKSVICDLVVLRTAQPSCNRRAEVPAKIVASAVSDFPLFAFDGDGQGVS